MTDPRDPLRPRGSTEISEAAERARERLRKEMEQVRVSINELLADQGPGEGSAFRRTFMERARGLSLAALGIVTAIGLANPSNLALNQAAPLLGGGSSQAPSSQAAAPHKASTPAERHEGAARGGAALADVGRPAGTPSAFVAGPPTRRSAPRLMIDDLRPLAPGDGGHRHSAKPPQAPAGQAPPSGPAAPETIPAILTEPPAQQPGGGSGGGGSKGGGGADGGPISSGSGSGGSDSPGNGHGHGHGPGGPPGHSPSQAGGGGAGSHGHGPPKSPGSSGGHGRGHGPPATAPPSTAPPSESAPPPPSTPSPGPPGATPATGGGPGNANGNGPPGGTPPGQARK